MMRQYFLTLIFILGSATVAFAQGGSNYSIIGLGDYKTTIGAGYDGLAGTSYAVPSDNLINISNPALWSKVKSTRIQTGYRLNQQRITEGSDVTSQNNGKLDGAVLLFAIDTANGIAASIGFMPSSSVNYSAKRNFSLKANSDSITGRTLYTGSGGLTTLFLGASTNITSDISVALVGLYNFGSIFSNAESTIDIENSFVSYARKQDKFSGAGFQLGVNYNPTPELAVGASVAYMGNASYTSLFRTGTYFGTTFDEASSAGTLSGDTTTQQDLETSMPLRVGLGASYISGKFLFAADYELIDFSSLNYRSLSNTTFQSSSRISFGVMRMGVQSVGTAYVDKINFSIGAGYKELYYTVNNQPITETYAAFGAQLPFGGAAKIDLSITGGVRGTLDSSLIKEEFLRFGFSLSVGETWFIPFRRE